MNKLWCGRLFGLLVNCKLCLIILICPLVFSVWIPTTFQLCRSTTFAVFTCLKILEENHFPSVDVVPCYLFTLYSERKLPNNKRVYYIATAINLAEVIEDLTILKILAFSLNLPLSLGIILVMHKFCFILRPWKTHAFMNKPQKKLSDY